MEQMILMGGQTIVVRDGMSPDGSRCVFARHPDLPGCVAYAESRTEALRLLAEARSAHLASVMRHGESVPQSSATRAALWPMTVTPVTQSANVPSSGNVNAVLQSA